MAANMFDDLVEAPEQARPNMFDDLAAPPRPNMFEDIAAAPDAQVSGETPTYGSALKAQLTEFPVRAMAGAVENLGDVIAPPEQDPSIREAFLKIPQRGIGVGGLGLAEAIGTGLRQSATRYLIPESLRAIGQDLTRQGAMVGAEANAYLKQETPQDLNMLQRASISAISSAAQMAPYLVGNRLGATGPLLRNTALGQFGASSGLEEYTQAKAGGAEPYQAQRAMELNALAEIGGEKLGLDTLMKGGPGYFKKFALQDIGGEIGTTIAQSLGEKAIYNPKKWSSAGEIGSDIVETALGAAMGAGAMKGLDVGLGLVTPGEAKAKKELDQILYENKQAEEDFTAIVERHGLGETPATPPPSAHALTPAEEELAAIQEKQLAGGLANVPAHPEAPYFGPTLNQALAPEPAPAVADEGWVSDLVQKNRAKRREIFPPSEIPPENWQITIATTDERVVGLTPAQVGAPPPGAVYAIRAPGQEENFPTQQYTLLAQDLTDWLQKYAPDTGLILNLNQFNKIQGSSTYGLHQPVFYKTANGKNHLYHIITPRELASIASYGTADAKTVGAVLSGSAHEFGHLIRQSALRRSMAQTMGAYWSYEINKALAQDTMTPELWAKFAAEAPLEHALAAQWKDYQTRILNGTMPSSEFMETWAGARKLGESIARNLPENRDLYEWERNQLRTHGLPATGASAAELLVGKRGVNGEFSKDQMADLLELTNFNEYMAEQFSRYAYVKEDILRSKFGNWFADAMMRLRALFTDLKTRGMKEGIAIIQPHETFKKWLDAQVALNANRTNKPKGKFALSKELSAEHRRIAEELLAARKAKKEAGRAEAEMPEEPAAPAGPGSLAELLKQAEGAKPKGKKEELKAAPPSADVVNTLPDDKELVLAELDNLYPLGAKATNVGDRTVYLSMLEKIRRGDLLTVLDHIQFVKGLDQAEDRQYSSKVLKRLPKKEVIKVATLELTLRQRDIKEAERQFYQGLIQRYPQGVPLDAIEDFLQDRKTTLSWKAYHQDKWHVAERLALRFKTGSETSSDVTLVWEAPFSMPQRSHHFDDNEAYVGHTRHIDDGDTRIDTELQSDYWQQKRSERIELKSPGDQKKYGEFSALMDSKETLATIREVFADPDIHPDMRNEVLATHYPSTLKEYLRFLNQPGDAKAITAFTQQDPITTEQQLAGLEVDLDRQLQELQARQEAITPRQVEEFADVKGMEKDWPKVLIRHVVRLAMEQGKRRYLFRTARTAALLENWSGIFFIEQLKGKKHSTENVPFTGVVVSQGVNFYVELQYSDHTSSIIVPAENREGRLLEKLLQKASRVDYGDNQTIYLRYLNEVMPYLEKEYGAKPLTAYGHEFLEVSLEQDQPEAYVAWDREVENPLETPNPEVVLTTFAGMADEEARNPAKREEALAAWERSKFDSPYWKRFWGASKAVGNDGAPVKAWAGTGGRVLMVGPTEGFVLSENPATVSTPRTEGKQEDGPAKPYLQGFYASLQNPLEQDMAFAPYNEAAVLLLMAQAIDAGHDGMILRNIKDPDVTTMYVPFSRAQIAMEDEIEPLDETDMMGWNAASDAQQAVRAFGKLLQNFGNRSWLRANHARQRTVDYLIQLQQVAAGQPEDRALQAFMFAKMEGERFKNQMQYVPNEVTKKMLNAFGSSKAAVEDLKKLLAAEQKTGVLASELVQVNGVWEVQDGLRLRELMVSVGLDPTSKRGQEVVTHYLNVRNSFLLQFTGLHNALTSNALRRFSATPALLNRETLVINELIKKLREQPFVPQGHFGNYVVFVQQDQGPVKPGQRRFITVYKRHYESQADRDQAYLRMEKARGGDTTQRVGTRDLKDAGGLPIQLPSELLETINETGFFDDDQIKVLSELMVSTKYAKLGARYEKIGGSVKGANDDFVRTYAAFTWHNSNYVWKLQYGPALRAATAIARKNIKDLERDTMLTPEEKLAQVTRQRRNLSLMENAVQYIMNPENELQALRYWITMAYLAYGLTTAAFNLSTQIHYWAALTTEYGELKGNLLYAQSLKDTTSLPFWSAMEKSTTLSQKERDRIGRLRWAYERAVYDGLLDQSYAYFLAGQANAGGVLDTTMTGWVGPTAHTAMEAGMLPFRAVERGNRLSTFLGYFQAEMDRGVPELWAYRHAAAKVDLLQGAYDPANRPMLMRGKKAILFMFASFTQMSQWTMWGGYERTARATARAQGREAPSLARSSTMKLWVIYMMLGGLMGLPGAQNLLDIAKWFWRKVFGDANIEVELRRFIQDMGKDADAILHGALHDFMGFDLSGKFGLGRVLPGTDLLNRNFQDPFTGLGQATVQMAGPAGGVAADGLRMLGKFQQGDISGGVKEFPGVIGSMAKAWDAYLLQENTPTAGVTLKDGTRLTWDEKRGEFRDLTTKELLGMALGANPTILSKNRAEHFAMQGEKIYWETRRGDLTDKYWRALRTGDTEMLEKVEGQIEKYNEVAPDVSLMIRRKDLNTQVRGRRKAARDAELHGLAGKHGKAIARDMQGLYRAETPEE
jgi:hypothetical protein